jgi:hypothetical protein
MRLSPRLLQILPTLRRGKKGAGKVSVTGGTTRIAMGTLVGSQAIEEEVEELLA